MVQGTTADEGYHHIGLIDAVPVNSARRRSVAGEVSDGGSRGSISKMSEISTLGLKAITAFLT
jgi:hypothetical protein